LGCGLSLGFGRFGQEGMLSSDTASCTSKLLKLEANLK